MYYTFENVTDEKLDEGILLIEDEGGTVLCDGTIVNGCTFEVSGVEGNYKHEDEVLSIEITDKPWLVSWDMIEEKLNEFFL